MTGHLNDGQWAAAVLNEGDQATASHLAECPTCRDELRQITVATEAARAKARNMAELPEAFWRRQRESIHARLEHRDLVRPWKRWIWATATVTLVLLASAMLSHNGAPPVPPTPQADPDDALLLSVHQSIETDVPQALRPAALLTEEMARAEAARRTP
jgi:predicted anti-sigma-YlaC factor YlaD